MRAIERRRTEAATWQTRLLLLCDAAVCAGCEKPRTPRRLLPFLKNANEREISGYLLFYTCLGLHMRSGAGGGESHVASLLSRREREFTSALIFLIHIPLFSTPRWSVRLFASFPKRDLSFFADLFFLFFFFLFLETNSVIIQKCATTRRGRRWHLSMRAPHRAIYYGSVTPRQPRHNTCSHPRSILPPSVFM